MSKDKKCFEVTPAVVSVSLGVTLNMDNFESLKINMGLSYPCKPTDKDVEKAFETVFRKVYKKLDSKVEELTQRKIT